MVRIRPAFTLLFATAVVGASLIPTAEGARRRAPCKIAKSKTIVQNRSVLVYEVAGDEGSTMYACRKSTGRRAQLAEASDDGLATSASYQHVRLAGGRIAWVSTATDRSCKADCPPGYEATSSRIAVFDVKARRSRAVVAAPLGGALVLSENGGVAWAARGAGPGLTDIHASPGGTEDTTLDSGGIDPASLAIEITIISWRRDGVERFARLR